MKWLAFGVGVFLAGCSAPVEPQGSSDDSMAGPPPEPLQVAQGAVQWHNEDAHGPTWPMALVSQSLVNPCVWDDESRGREVYFNNVALPATPEADKIPNGTKRLEVLFEWAPTDYAHDRLVLAYQPAGRNAPFESQWITNGEPAELDVVPSTAAGHWSFWACVSRGDDQSLANPTGGPRTFAGTLSYEITALP